MDPQRDAGLTGAAPVSVVVPCYRCADTIERAVRSVAAQTRRPAELILVDDASPDGSAAALERVREAYGADWIRIIRLPRNVGPASARNAGWDSATQPYIAFLDSDDAWHPRKIEIQHAWMEAHPEIALTGHGSRQLASDAEMPADPDGEGSRNVSLRSLYLSNPFITPSVMLRRDLPQRFEHGKRHMEDYLLWLDIASGGGRIARLSQVLAYTFKAPFGEKGLSAQHWQMERGEIAVFASLRRKGHIGIAAMLALSGYSLVKFARRMLMLATGYSPSGGVSRPELLYVGAYLVLTQAMTALLIVAGLFGRSELAADIGVVQAATLATFFAFSGNARNLILTDRASVPRGTILATRLALLLPLGAAAALLCAIVGTVEASLILVLVARRGIEWIGELYLSECELLGRSTSARNSLLLQALLLAVAAGAIALDAGGLLWVLAAWALLPAIPLAGFVARGAAASLPSIGGAMRALLPHLGATAASGLSLYAFRILLVLVAGKAVAGDLFAAFAIGSFPGSVFANVLGATVSLHEERVGRAYLPRILWSVTLAYLFGAIALLGLHWAAPQLLAGFGKTDLFWTALGLSLLGGVVMIVAQRMRLRLIASGAAGDLFGADVLMHIYLIAAIPALYAVGQTGGLAALYALNALLALLFYASALREEMFPYGGQIAQRLVFAVTLAVFLPLFFMITGELFNPPEAVVDSGGILRSLPLPFSLLACSAGLIIFGRFAHAIVGLWAIFGLLLMMLISTALAGGESDTVDRAKMLLLLQVLLPTFGLVLGAVLDPRRRHEEALQLAILAVILLIVPAQLLASWLEGNRSLRHSVFLFGVYQHLQFVPVILVCAYFVALPGLWARWQARGRPLLVAALALLAIYAVASYSVLAMFAVLAGTLLFFAVRFRGGQRKAAALAMAGVLGSFSGYAWLVSDMQPFHIKFAFLFPAEDDLAFVSGNSMGAKPRLRGGWEIVGLPGGGDLLRIELPKTSRETALRIEGELHAGELAVLVTDAVNTQAAPRAELKRAGPFSLVIEVNQARGDAVFRIVHLPGTRGHISSMRWLYGPSAAAARAPEKPAAPAGAAQEVASIPQPAPQGASVPNVAERFSDWKLFGLGILEARKAFFFGHPKPLAREQRTSAHNFYIDFTYNFGFLALLPLIALIAYTGSLLWRRRRKVMASGSLLALALVVAFLVLVESNLKVSLRQPYPGIAIFFLWGMLLVRLREPRAESG